MKKVEAILAVSWCACMVFALWLLAFYIFDKSDTIKTKDDSIAVIWNDGKEISAKGQIKEYDDKVVVRVPGALLQKEDGTVEPVTAKTLVFYKHEIKALVYVPR